MANHLDYDRARPRCPAVALSAGSGARWHDPWHSGGALRDLVLAATTALGIALVGCADPAAEKAARERDDFRLRVLADAMFYWRCAQQPVVVAAECDGWREAYERDLAKYRGDEQR